MRLSPQLHVRRKSTALRTRKLRLRFALPHHRWETPVVPTFRRAPLSLHGSSQPGIRLARLRHAQCRAQAGRQSNRPCTKAPHDLRNRSQGRGRHQGLKPLRSPNRGHSTRSNDPPRRVPNPSTRIRDNTTTHVKNIRGWANATAAPRRAAVLLNRIPSLEPRAQSLFPPRHRMFPLVSRNLRFLLQRHADVIESLEQTMPHEVIHCELRRESFVVVHAALL